MPATAAGDRVADRRYLFTAEFPDSPPATTCERLKDDPSWQVESWPVGHNVVREAPERLLSVLRSARDE